MTASTETPDWTGQQIAYSHGGDLIKLSEAISIAIAAAVAAEREACAQEAEKHKVACDGDGEIWIVLKIAANIRGRP